MSSIRVRFGGDVRCGRSVDSLVAAISVVVVEKE
jgi:hypothetical protein